MLSLAEENDEWLYSDEARDAKADVFKERFKKMEKKMKNIKMRVDEY